MEKLTDKQKRLVRDILAIQISILNKGTTKNKCQRIEQKLLDLGFTEDDMDGIYGI